MINMGNELPSVVNKPFINGLDVVGHNIIIIKINIKLKTRLIFL